MPEITFNGEKLKREVKANWSARRLDQDTRFIHCSGIDPLTIKESGGIDPQFSSEWCVEQETYTRFCCLSGTRFVRIGPGRFIFAFPYGSGSLRVPKAASIFGFSVGGYVYVLKLPEGTQYFCRNGILNLNNETGFPVAISLDQIESVYKVGAKKQLTEVNL